jgi:SAM-dependent methyltransferase
VPEQPAQAAAFSEGEGDRYFERNRSVIAGYEAEADPIVQVLAISHLRPRSVLEIGASAGHRVATLVERYGCRGMAVDPSRAAVAEGRRAHPEVEFAVASMEDVPTDEEFDLVVVNFVFHWVDRSLLLRSVSEVDRLVVENGHLLIGDFLPSGPSKTPYHHQAGLWTFKQDYADLFVASGLYCRIVSVSGEYAGTVPSGSAAPGHRAAFTLLHKSLSGHYQTLQIDS